MPRHPSPHPTELELEILKILWRDGPCSVRDVRDTLVSFRDLAYTSVMTMMNIMREKGYLKRKKEGGCYVYRARITKKSTAGRMLGDMVDRVFDGSAASLMVNLLETAEIDSEELKELRKRINRKAKELPE
jgi:BlaI family transcriptional regulator, penicillinase repressor